MKPIENKYKFEYIIDYKKPISVSEYTNALNAISNEYENFLHVKYGSEKPEAELYIKEIKKGSIITTLVEHSNLLIPFLGDVNTVFEFGDFLKNSFDYLLSGNKSEEKHLLDAKNLTNFQKVIEPGTHSNNNISINIVGDNNQIILKPLTANEMDSRIIRERIKEEKKDLNIKEKKIFQKQALVLDQIKRDLNSTKGNKGLIKEINDKSLNIVWENDDEKNKMLSCDDNPLKMIFIIDVEIVEANSITMLYKVIKLHEIIEP